MKIHRVRLLPNYSTKFAMQCACTDMHIHPSDISRTERLIFKRTENENFDKMCDPITADILMFDFT